ncbi:ParB/RepB/Spo0J family partition protein [Bittarella massiliensis]|uniref:ParB/RepB/Spo0J family partition protein n=1 Tax=Bittarella massiliensis (ex Durand et al. 2017) TaxID=1720313 RepID=UPI00163BC6B6|nr:ParB/RepB/Spo0J family partition protein [Bittarella massiliensis (ex Durand et al. 2017)]MBC2871949.1 ParB/RepB/Spo0J family partition protein [Bittarella massiliensis (ex Durand et al. 2017)]
MADDKLKAGPESPGEGSVGDAQTVTRPPALETVEEPAAGTGPVRQPEQSVTPGMGGDVPAQPAPEHSGPEALPGEDTPAAPSGKVIDLTAARATGEQISDAPDVEDSSPKHGDEAFRDLFGNKEKTPWEKSLDEIKEEEKAQKRRGRPKKAKDKAEPDKPEKGPGPRTGRPAKADKAARDKSPSPGVLDKVSRGGKKDKDKETGSGGVGPGVKAPKGKPAPVKEAEAPAPEIKLPPTPEVPPRPVEQGKIVYLKLSELHPFHTLRDHPFKVQDDKAMDDLVGTIKEHGIMTPATVRPEKDGKGYEIIAGHRRCHGGDRAGLDEIPCIVREMTDLEAVREMKNSNKQRGDPLPSELAKLLDLELEAIKRQGARPKNDKEAEALGKLSVEIVGKEHDMNYKKVLRYVRLNHLVPELLEKVDAKNMGFMPAVELSYIKPENQRLIAVSIDGEQSSPSVKQAKRLRELDQEGLLNGDVIDGILSEEKREVDNVIISTDELNKYFGKEVTPAKMKEQIIALLDEWKEKQPPELAKPEKKNELDK